jgi:hypothetical protein
MDGRRQGAVAGFFASRPVGAIHLVEYG